MCNDQLQEQEKGADRGRQGCEAARAHSEGCPAQGSCLLGTQFSRRAMLSFEQAFKVSFVTHIFFMNKQSLQEVH